MSRAKVSQKPARTAKINIVWRVRKLWKKTQPAIEKSAIFVCDRWNTIRIVCSVRVFMQPRRKLPPWTDCSSVASNKTRIFSAASQRRWLFSSRNIFAIVWLFCVFVCIHIFSFHRIRCSFYLTLLCAALLFIVAFCCECMQNIVQKIRLRFSFRFFFDLFFLVFSFSLSGYVYKS